MNFATSIGFPRPTILLNFIKSKERIFVEVAKATPSVIIEYIILKNIQITIPHIIGVESDLLNNPENDSINIKMNERNATETNIAIKFRILSTRP